MIQFLAFICVASSEEQATSDGIAASVAYGGQGGSAYIKFSVRGVHARHYRRPPTGRPSSLEIVERAVKNMPPICLVGAAGL